MVTVCWGSAAGGMCRQRSDENPFKLGNTSTLSSVCVLMLAAAKENARISKDSDGMEREGNGGAAKTRVNHIRLVSNDNLTSCQIIGHLSCLGRSFVSRQAARIAVAAADRKQPSWRDLFWLCVCFIYFRKKQLKNKRREEAKCGDGTLAAVAPAASESALVKNPSGQRVPLSYQHKEQNHDASVSLLQGSGCAATVKKTQNRTKTQWAAFPLDLDTLECLTHPWDGFQTDRQTDYPEPQNSTVSTQKKSFQHHRKLCKQ